MQHPPHRWVPRILLAALLAVVGACADNARDPTAPERTRVVVLSSKGAAPSDTTAPPATTECTYELIDSYPDPDGEGWVYVYACTDGGGSGGGDDDGGAGGGSGGGGDTCDPTAVIGGCDDYGGGDDTMGDDTNFDCHAFGPGCDLRDPDSTERGGVQNLIDRIRTDDLTCSWIRDTAQGMVGHSLQVWDNKIYASGGGVVWGDAPYITKNGVTAFGMHLWTGGMDARVVAHEAMHGLEWLHGEVRNGRTMEQWEHFCT